MADTKPIPLNRLKFDYENPRLVEYGAVKNMKEDDLVRLLSESMAVDEIILSLVTSGYFPNDPLLAIKQGEHYIVIEGNRRLAALKIITAYDKFKDCYPSSIPRPSKALVNSLQEIPVFVETSRKSSWQYIGFKHVNGAAKWSSFAKAEYIAMVHNDFGVPLDEIALHIGDSNKTVEKLYQALMVIEQAEKNKIFDRNNVNSARLFFSHLYTGLQYEGIRKYVGLKDLSDTSSPVKNRKELAEVLEWMFGNKRDNIKPVIESQNPDLRNLDQVVQHKHSIQILRATRDLNAALESSRPDAFKFYESLNNVKLELYKSLQYVATGYDGDTEKLTIAESIEKMVEQLLSSMNSIRVRRKSSDGKKTKSVRK